MLLVTDAALYTVWGGSLAIGVVVAVVVAILLALIVRTARQIKKSTGQIWVDGQKVANATVHIPLLAHTNRTVLGILVRASGILDNTARIRAHAEECPGCPYCLLRGEMNRPGGAG
jgi:nicotinate-nucleotide pyrophosphorylase